MRKIKVITDSNADLPKEMLEARGIEAVPLHIILGEKKFPDDGSLKNEGLFEYADVTGTMPKTMPVSISQFEEVFRKWLKDDHDILFMGVSGKLSATVRDAVAAAVTMTAAEKVDRDRISVVDSTSLSSGIGLLALEAADMADSGMELKEITQRVLALRPKIHVGFIVGALKYFYMGGWCSKFTSVVGDSLNIKPTIEMKSGEVTPGQGLMGKDYLDKYYKIVMKDAERIDPKRIFITHCLNSEGAGEVKERLGKEFGFNNVIVTDMSNTTASQGGSGSLGISFLYK